MTLSEAGEVFAYWAENPPAHLVLQAIARMLGWAPAASPSDAPQSFDELAAAPPPGLAVIRGSGPGMPPPVLDPETLRQRNRARAGAPAAAAAPLGKDAGPRDKPGGGVLLEQT